MNKRLLLITGLIMVASAAFAQSKIDSAKNAVPPPRKEPLTDVPFKTVKVVLSNDNTAFDLTFRDAVSNGWDISPFEFITKEEFAEQKKDSSLFFLFRYTENDDLERGTGLDFLSFEKGGVKEIPKENDDEFAGMKEVISLPLCAAGDDEGRSFAFIPAYISIIQSYIQKTINKRVNAYLGLSIYKDGLKGEKYDSVFFRKGDFTFSNSAARLAYDFNQKARYATQDEMDEEMANPTGNNLVALVIYPRVASKYSSSSYQMLICSNTGKLAFYREHSFGKNKKAGFSMQDYKSIMKAFNK